MGTKISELTAATDTQITGDDTLPVVESGVTKKTTVKQVRGHVSTIADLRAKVGADGDAVQLLESGKEGVFVYDASSSAADNERTVVKPTAASTGRWLRRYSGAINAKWSGAPADWKSTVEGILSASSSLHFPSGAYAFTGLDITSVNEKTLTGDGPSTVLNFSGPLAISGCRKITFKNIKINLTVDSATLLDLSADSFELYFENVIFEGDPTKATATIGASFTNTYINTFVNCHFIYFNKCLQFNTEANRNNFFGCTVRSGLTVGTVLVEHNAGQANSFTGTDLENCNRILDMKGGSLFFGEGCYFEAHNDAFGFQLTGGHVGFSRSYFNEVFFRLASGGSLELSRNWIKGSTLSNATSPLIRTLSGFARIILDNNILEGTTYLARFDPTIFNYLQVYNEGASSWGTAYPTTEHIHVNDIVYDVTSTAIAHCAISNVRASRNRAQNYMEGRQRYDGGSNGFQLVSSAWNYNALRLGSSYLWVDGSGNLRIKSSAPTSATDGTIVGTQS